MSDNRLFQLLFLLLEKGSATAPELAGRFEVSVRTIYRDIDQLSAAGIPVYAVQGKGGGIFINENYVLNKSLITEQEQRQILLALQGFAIAGEDHTNTLLAKLGGIFKTQNINWIEVDFSQWHKKSADHFQLIKDAIFSNHMLTFTYYSTKGEHINRIVEPLKLVYKDMQWYLYAFCNTRQDYRLFKLSRMKALQPSDQQFTRLAPDKAIDSINHIADAPVLLTLCFDKQLAYRVYDYFDSVSENENGDLLVHASYPINESLYHFLLSFGDQVQVLAPLEIREQMKARIKKMQEIYKT